MSLFDPPRADDDRLITYRTLIHPAIVFALSWLPTVALDQLLRTLAPGLGPPPPGYQALLLVGVLAEVIVGTLVFRARGAAGSRVRELVVYLGLMALFLATVATGGVITAADFWSSATRVGKGFVYPLLISGLCWAGAYRVHTRLRPRELLLAALGSISPATASAAILRRNAGQMEQAVHGMRAVQRTLIGDHLLLLLLLLLMQAFGLLPGRLTVLTLIASAGAATLIWGSMNMALVELRLAADGQPVPKDAGRRRRALAALLVGAAFVTALVVAQGRSAVPAELLARIVAWLNDLMTVADDGEILIPPVRESQPPGVLLDYLLLPETPLSWRLRLLWQMLARAIRLLVIGAAALFITAPLWRRVWRRSGRLVAAVAAVRNWWLRLLAKLRILLRDVARWLGSRRQNRPVSSAANPQTAPPPGRRLSIRRRRQISALLAGLRRVMQLGARAGCAYRSSMGPAEYLDDLIDTWPDLATQLDLIGSLFEEARYSARALSADGMRRFRAAIEVVVKVRGGAIASGRK